MSTIYKTIAGDTFSLIARKVYGTEAKAGDIARANPGLREPLTTGTIIFTPVDTEAPKNRAQQSPSENPNETALLINGERFRFWSEVRITRSVDSMDTVEFLAPFNSDDATAREAFRPFSYQTVEVAVGGAPLFTGTVLSVSPRLDDTERTVSVSGYSLPGVLNDCTAPASAFPIEFNNQGLRAVANALTAPFGIKVVFLSSPGANFERVACEPGRKVLDFLIELAQQRNLVISSSPRGELVFQRSVEGASPVAVLRQGESPLLSVTPTFNPQEYYSHITGLEAVVVGTGGSQTTVKNTQLQGAIRPYTFSVPDTLDADAGAAVSAKVGRMFGNMVSYSVAVDTWRDINGDLWEPNTIVKLQAKDAMIYSEYAFEIRSIEFTRSEASETAVLNLVIPGAFNGKIPKGLPWD